MEETTTDEARQAFTLHPANSSSSCPLIHISTLHLAQMGQTTFYAKTFAKFHLIYTIIRNINCNYVVKQPK